MGAVILLLMLAGLAYQLFFVFYYAVVATMALIFVIFTLGLILVSEWFRNLFSVFFSADTSHITAVGSLLHNLATPLFSVAFAFFLISLFLHIFGERRTSRTVKIVLSSILIVVSVIGLAVSVSSGGVS